MNTIDSLEIYLKNLEYPPSISTFVITSIITFFLQVKLTACAQYAARLWPPISTEVGKNKTRKNPVVQYTINSISGGIITAITFLYMIHTHNYYEENIMQMKLAEIVTYFAKVFCIVIGLTLLYDLQTYIFHRTNHHFPRLYLSYHSVHHENIRPNGMLDGIYGDTIEYTIIGIFALWPLCFLPPLPISAILTYLLIIAVFAQFNHSGRKVEIPWLMYTARFHHYHHLKYKVNFCEHLWFWDWLFGTLYLPPNYS